MRQICITATLVLATAVGLNAQNAASITVDVAHPGHAISPTLWGIFFEDINLSADGGIYAEMVRNRSFEDSDKPEHWSLVSQGGGKAKISVCLEKPAAGDLLHTRNRRSLRLEVEQASANNPVGVANEGYWGIAVSANAMYDLSFSGRATPLKNPVVVSLEGANGRVYARKSFSGLGADWKDFEASLTASGTDPKARLVFRLTEPGTLWIDKVSLFPRNTWKGHGLRTDLMQMLADLKPAFIRFPGGCWVEGDTMREAYRWKETMGDLWERRTQWNIWRYWATHGLGYHEYLQMCEDLGAEALFVINCGMSHKENVPMDQVGPYVQDALDAIEYAKGPVTSTWGALRAKNGHPAPFNLKYLQIGNENGGPAYEERYALFHKAVKERYPDLILIANDWGGPPKNVPLEVVDEHYYNNPEFFIRQAERYDAYDRQGPKIYVGEYAVTRDSGQGNLRGAIGEAAFMIGMERNSDVVTMSSYAPLFVHVNHRRWNPDLINFDNHRAYGIPSYYVQQLFSLNRGNVILPTTAESKETAEEPKGGAVGIGTWLTRAEFKDLKVTRGNETLFALDAARGLSDAKLLGRGDWKAEDGVLRQNNAGEENVRAIFGDKSWNDYTLSLKARKLSGAEGFLILFGVRDDNAKSWWNLGGWGNQRHAVEMGGGVGNQVNGAIETGRWYDIRVELKGNNLKCYLDGKLLHDVNTPAMKSLYASASKEKATGETILKVVNVAATPIKTEVRLTGASKLGGPAKVTTLTSANPTDENSLENPRKVAPVDTTLNLNGSAFTHVFPGNSLTVIRLKAE